MLHDQRFCFAIDDGKKTYCTDSHGNKRTEYCHQLKLHSATTGKAEKTDEGFLTFEKEPGDVVFNETGRLLTHREATDYCKSKKAHLPEFWELKNHFEWNHLFVRFYRGDKKVTITKKQFYEPFGELWTSSLGEGSAKYHLYLIPQMFAGKLPYFRQDSKNQVAYSARETSELHDFVCVTD